MEILRPGGTILSVTVNGYGKRTEIEEYRIQGRGGFGIINIQTSERNGKVVGVIQVSDTEELMLITEQGKILRMASKSIRTIGRATQGVRLIDIEGEDSAVSIARNFLGTSRHPSWYGIIALTHLRSSSLWVAVKVLSLA